MEGPGSVLQDYLGQPEHALDNGSQRPLYGPPLAEAPDRAEQETEPQGDRKRCERTLTNRVPERAHLRLDLAKGRRNETAMSTAAAACGEETWLAGVGEPLERMPLRTDLVSGAECDRVAWPHHAAAEAIGQGKERDNPTPRDPSQGRSCKLKSYAEECTCQPGTML